MGPVAGRGPRPATGVTPGPAAALPGDTLGLALSGGGIRSAAFGLGVIQALARADWLRWVDYLSTVSGGGYTGAFLGRFFDQCRRPGGLMGAIPNASPGAAQDRVGRELADSRSAPVTWLRRHSNYLSPTGLGEALTNFAGFSRNLLSIYVVLGLFGFAAYGVLNAVGYGSLPGGTLTSLAAELIGRLTPLTGLLPAGWVGPWVVAAEASVWLAIVPLMVAYWLVSQDLPETFIAPALVAAAAIALALLLLTESPLSLAVLTAAVCWALVAWANVRRTEGHADPFNPARTMLARNFLTRRLAFWMGAALVLAGLGVVDGLGRWLARLMLDGGLTAGNVGRWFASAGAAVFGVAGVLRMAVRTLAGSSGRVSALLSAPAPYLLAAVIVLVGAVPPLVALAFASHIAYELGDAYGRGLWITGGAVALCALLGSRQCVRFVNRSGPLGIYAGRLARAFFGAVNPARRVHPDGDDVTHVVPGDDVRFDRYRPDLAGGPLHLVNCAVNETVDVASQRGLRDRGTENMAVGPAGVTVAQRWHALWAPPRGGGPALAPVAIGDGPHPFLTAEGDPVPVEPLTLREWVAISGAAVSPGMGRLTSPARALLLTLANVRLGYWWNSGLNSGQRRDVPVKTGLWATLTGLVAVTFRAQSLLLSELAGRFAGPWYRYWYLSDGGNFEVTGAYELLRRRVPFVIVCDAGQDAEHVGGDLAQLVRLARVDLGAEVEEVITPANKPQQYGVPSNVADHLGNPGDLLRGDGRFPRKHAALLLVRYPAARGGPGRDPWLGRTHTWVLYVKATVTGDEPADVLNYAALHPDFPNETTLDQVFDEPQWESYRKLGEHIGGLLFV